MLLGALFVYAWCRCLSFNGKTIKTNYARFSSNEFTHSTFITLSCYNTSMLCYGAYIDRWIYARVFLGSWTFYVTFSQFHFHRIFRYHCRCWLWHPYTPYIHTWVYRWNIYINDANSSGYFSYFFGYFIKNFVNTYMCDVGSSDWIAEWLSLS